MDFFSRLYTEIRVIIYVYQTSEIFIAGDILH